jgi:hypothetical protein
MAARYAPDLALSRRQSAASYEGIAPHVGGNSGGRHRVAPQDPRFVNAATNARRRQRPTARALSGYPGPLGPQHLVHTPWLAPITSGGRCRPGWLISCAACARLCAWHRRDSLCAIPRPLPFCRRVLTKLVRVQGMGLPALPAGCHQLGAPVLHAPSNPVTVFLLDGSRRAPAFTKFNRPRSWKTSAPSGVVAVVACHHRFPLPPVGSSWYLQQAAPAGSFRNNPCATQPIVSCEGWLHGPLLAHRTCWAGVRCARRPILPGCLGHVLGWPWSVW